MQDKYASAPPYTAGAFREHHQNLLHKQQCQHEVCREELRTVLLPRNSIASKHFQKFWPPVE